MKTFNKLTAGQLVLAGVGHFSLAGVGQISLALKSPENLEFLKAHGVGKVFVYRMLSLKKGSGSAFGKEGARVLCFARVVNVENGLILYSGKLDESYVQ